MRAVFDTNVLISAWLSPGGTASQCLAAAEQGLITSLTCEPILDEFIEKLHVKFDQTPEQAAQISRRIRQISIVISPIRGGSHEITTDSKDNLVIECAVVGQATHIITGDRRHLLPVGSYRGVVIITPAECVRLLRHP
mgnify:CR=1 FL=1